MKGVIIKCLSELVSTNFGKDKWHAILEKSGVDKNAVFLVIDNVSETDAMKIVDSTCKVLNITIEQAGDAFGDYWVNVFAPKLYSSYYSGSNSTKELLLKMDKVHQDATRNIPDARPPKFDYEWKDNKTLIMKYNSQRGLIDILVGLIKGVGRYYKENIRVTKLGRDRVQIVFEK